VPPPTVTISTVAGAPACVRRVEITCVHGRGVDLLLSKGYSIQQIEAMPDWQQATLPVPTRAELIGKSLVRYGQACSFHPPCTCLDNLALRYSPLHDLGACPEPRRGGDCRFHRASVN
jgi:hypothetical protein